MAQHDTTLAEQTRALLAEHGIRVTDEGVARARAELRAADARTTAADWQELDEFIAAAAR